MGSSIELTLKDIPAPDVPGLFHVRRLASHPACFAGRDTAGNPALLVEASGEGRIVPLRLAGIEARFAVPCRVAEPGVSAAVATLTAITCLSREPGIESYFAGAAESLLALLPSAPTTAQVADVVQRLVALFQKLRRPAKRTLTGLIGEVCLIRGAADPSAAVAAWRVDPDDRYDFSVGQLRLDAKAAATRRRTHAVSFEQANPPETCVGLFASMFVEDSGGGTSVAELLDDVEAKLVDAPDALLKFRTVVADSLGDTAVAAMEWRFDLVLAETSLALYAARDVPAIRPPVPPGVSGVRFSSDFGGCTAVSVGQLEGLLEPHELSILPRAAGGGEAP